MWILPTRPVAALALCALAFPAQVAAQSGAADQCMALPDGAARLECMRAALEKAEALLRSAGIDVPPASATVTARQDRSDRQQFSTLGSDQVAARNGTREAGNGGPRYNATIVSFSESVPGRMRFALDNGQVWQQTEADAQRLDLPRQQPVDVELWSTWSGGYRMLLRDQRRTVRVERIR